MTALGSVYEEPCPSCGDDPNDDTLHCEGCERIDTCGQFGPPWPNLPWHLSASPFYAKDHSEHMNTVSHFFGDPS